MPVVDRVLRCKECGKKFLGHMARKTCDKCRDKVILKKKKLYTFPCPTCGKVVKTSKSNKRYCTNRCKEIFWARHYKNLRQRKQ